MTSAPTTEMAASTTMTGTTGGLLSTLSDTTTEMIASTTIADTSVTDTTILPSTTVITEVNPETTSASAGTNPTTNGLHTIAEHTTMIEHTTSASDLTTGIYGNLTTVGTENSTTPMTTYSSTVTNNNTTPIYNITSLATTNSLETSTLDTTAMSTMNPSTTVSEITSEVTSSKITTSTTPSITSMTPSVSMSSTNLPIQGSTSSLQSSTYGNWFLDDRFDFISFWFGAIACVMFMIVLFLLYVLYKHLCKRTPASGGEEANVEETDSNKNELGNGKIKQFGVIEDDDQTNGNHQETILGKGEAEVEIINEDTVNFTAERGSCHSEDSKENTDDNESTESEDKKDSVSPRNSTNIEDSIFTPTLGAVDEMVSNKDINLSDDVKIIEKDSEIKIVPVVVVEKKITAEDTLTKEAANESIVKEEDKSLDYKNNEDQNISQGNDDNKKEVDRKTENPETIPIVIIKTESEIARAVDTISVRSSSSGSSSSSSRSSSSSEEYLISETGKGKLDKEDEKNDDVNKEPDASTHKSPGISPVDTTVKSATQELDHDNDSQTIANVESILDAEKLDTAPTPNEALGEKDSKIAPPIKNKPSGIQAKIAQLANAQKEKEEEAKKEKIKKESEDAEQKKRNYEKLQVKIRGIVEKYEVGETSTVDTEKVQGEGEEVVPPPTPVVVEPSADKEKTKQMLEGVLAKQSIKMKKK